MNVMSYLFMVSAVGLERYVGVLHSLRYNELMTRCRCFMMLACTWLHSLTFILILVQFAEWDLNRNICDVGTSLPEACHHVFMASIWSAIFATIFIYLRIMRALRHQLNQITPLELSADSSIADNLRALKINLQVIKSFLVIVGFFILCWIPSFLAIESDFVGLPQQVTDALVLFKIPQMAVLFNSFFNPIIYALKMKAFRDPMMRVLRCKALSVSDLETAGS